MRIFDNDEQAGVIYLPDTPNTSRRVLRGVCAIMALIFSQNNQMITCKDV